MLYSPRQNVGNYRLPWWLSDKQSASNAGDASSIPGLGRFYGEGNGNPLQYFVWRIPWTEEPGGLQSMGLQRVRHDWVTNSYKPKSKKHKVRQGKELMIFCWWAGLVKFLMYPGVKGCPRLSWQPNRHEKEQSESGAVGWPREDSRQDRDAPRFQPHALFLARPAEAFWSSKPSLLSEQDHLFPLWGNRPRGKELIPDLPTRCPNSSLRLPRFY